MIAKAFFIAILALFFTSLLCSGQSPLRLWYSRPAGQWEETLPLGNGRLGMMPDGGVEKEKIVLNDITLWSGAPQDANNYEAYKKLPEIRRLLLEGKNDEAQAIIDQSFICKGPGSEGANYGCYQTLGDLDLQVDYTGAANSSRHVHDNGMPSTSAGAVTPDGRPIKPDRYKRSLSLDNAIASCSYQVNGTTYKREYFTSFGDDIDIIRITADRPGQLNCRITIHRPERSVTTTEGDELQLSGQLDNGIDGKGMSYLTRVHARQKEGTLTTEQNALVIRNATEILLYVAAATDWKNPAFKEKISQVLAAAIKKSYTLQKQQHITNYQRLFNRVSLSLGERPISHTPSPANLPTNERLVYFHKDPGSDNGLPVLFYQFGRYLSISSTRVGLLPPNLQGLWANQIRTPWTGDYHLDINVEMNHWPVEVSNLSELNLPLAELVRGMISHGEKTAKAYYNADGWVAHVITNIWGFTEPGEAASWGITKCGSGWLCDNLGGIYPNLLSAGPPFQIDGNFGATAAIAEMLLQSHAGFIQLLPALPDNWKAAGEVKGLKARGNFTIDMKWKDGKVVTYRVASAAPRKIKVKVNGALKEILSEKI